MSDVDGLRQEIAEALAGEPLKLPGKRETAWELRLRLTAAVLPVVTAWTERQARERAAEELLDASVFIRQMGKADADVLSYLRHKAAALADDARGHDAGHDGQQR